MSSYIQNFDEWFKSLNKIQKINLLYHIKSNYFDDESRGNSINEGFEKRGYYAGPAPDMISGSKQCPRCNGNGYI